MARVTQFFRTSFRAVTAALFIGLVTQTFASAQSGEPVKLVKLEPEVAYTFNYDGAVYEVYNTHLINFAGLERIEIRTLAGPSGEDVVVAAWMVLHPGSLRRRHVYVSRPLSELFRAETLRRRAFPSASPPPAALAGRVAGLRCWMIILV